MLNLRDHLHDLLAHMIPIGVNVIKIIGDENATKCVAYEQEGRRVIAFATFKQPCLDFTGVFGLPNLGMLKTIVDFSEYAENAVITVGRTTRDNIVTPDSITFETASGDFVNSYRLMSKKLAEDLVNLPPYKPPVWQVEFEPQVAAINKLKKQLAANSDSERFTTKMEGTTLKIYFGDPSTHSGNFVFQDNCQGYLSKPMNWPAKQFLGIMSLPGKKTVKFSEQQACEITVETDLIKYQYVMLARK